MPDLDVRARELVVDCGGQEVAVRHVHRERRGRRVVDRRRGHQPDGHPGLVGELGQ